VSAVDLMLLGTVLLWALNIVVTRWVVTNGFQPLAYATVRYAAAIALFLGYTWWRERSFRIARRDFRFVGIAALMIFVNQLCFVNSTHLTSASTVGLVLGTTPIFAGLLATVVGLERPGQAFWIAAVVSFGGVALIAASAGASFSGKFLGNLLAIATAATWAAYSVAISPLMRRYSPFRISSVVLPLGWVPLALVSIPQVSSQTVDGFGWMMALAFAFAVVGPLFLTNILWFTAIGKVGPSRATLFANLEPFFAVLFAVLLLSESLNGLEIAGGALIAVGIVIERRGHHASEPVVVLGE
jgi:drug/metabolite transporter (DMT)-like permease